MQTFKITYHKENIIHITTVKARDIIDAVCHFYDTVGYYEIHQINKL